MKKNAILFYYATVTQLDRVLGYELRSREFESLRSHQFALLV